MFAYTESPAPTLHFGSFDENISFVTQPIPPIFFSQLPHTIALEYYIFFRPQIFRRK